MFAWTYLDGEGEECGSSERFGHREEAEAWMGDSWSDLRERGVEEVVLFDLALDRRVYRMALSPDVA